METLAGTFNAQAVANTLWAYATMGREPGAGLMSELEGRAEALAGTFNAQGVANTLCAYATMGREPGAGLMREQEGRAEDGHVECAERCKHAVGVCDDGAGAWGGVDAGAGGAGGRACLLLPARWTCPPAPPPAARGPQELVGWLERACLLLFATSCVLNVPAFITFYPLFINVFGPPPSHLCICPQRVCYFLRVEGAHPHLNDDGASQTSSQTNITCSAAFPPPPPPSPSPKVSEICDF